MAHFAATTITGYAPLTVQFANMSTGTMTGSLWSFGDGITSTETSPSHIYAQVGGHTVALTVTGLGGHDTMTKTDYVQVLASPPVVAGFSADPLTGHPPLAVPFTNASTGTVTSYLWSFGDGITSTLSSPSHTYTAAGSYTVTLTAIGVTTTDTMTRANYIQPYTFADVPPTHPRLAGDRGGEAGRRHGRLWRRPTHAICPDAVVKREEIAVFIDRALGWPPTPGVNVFTDLANDYWATPFAETLRAHGVTAGCQARASRCATARCTCCPRPRSPR